MRTKPIMDHHEEGLDNEHLYSDDSSHSVCWPTAFASLIGAGASEAVCPLCLTSTSPEILTTGILRFWTGLPKSGRSSSSIMRVSRVRPAKCRRPLQAWQRTPQHSSTVSD